MQNPNDKKSLLKRLLPLLILLLALLVAFVLRLTKPEAKPVEIAEKAWLVGVEQVQLQTLSPSLTLYGRVESLWSSQLRAGVAADVVEVKVIEGDRFERDDVLVVLDDRDARLLLAQREAELREVDARIASEQTRHASNLDALPREQRLFNLTRKEVDRLIGLVSKQASAQSALDTARQAAERQAISLAARKQMVAEHDARLAELQAQRVRAEALRDQAKLELERCTVRAPFTGRVAQLDVAPGRRVRAGDALLDVFDTQAMVVRAQIPNRHLPTVRASLGQDEHLVVEGSLDGQQVVARLRSLAGEVAQGSAGVEGIFQLQEAGPLLQQGRFVRLDLQLPAVPGVVALPHEAIYGTDHVYRVQDSRMRGVPVQRVGEWRAPDGTTRVLVRGEGLSEGTPVITTQLPNAIEGLLVRQATED